MVVMKPVSMPTVSFKTFATGARQFVVHDPLETTRCSLVSVSWLTPNTMGRVGAIGGRGNQHALGAGGQMARRPCPWAVKMPVHSSAMVDAEILPRQFRRIALGGKP